MMISFSTLRVLWICTILPVMIMSCALRTLIPSLGPINRSSNMTVRVVFNNEDPKQNLSIKFDQTNTSINAEVRRDKCNSDLKDDSTVVCDVSIKSPLSKLATFSFVTSDDCAGSLSYQYYDDLNALGITQEPVRLSSMGGVVVFVSIPVTTFLQVSDRRLRIEHPVTKERVDYELNPADSYNALVPLFGKGKVWLAAQTDNLLQQRLSKDTTVLNTHIAINGIDFFPLATNVAFEQTSKQLRVIYIHKNKIGDIGWDYMHSYGSHRASQRFSVSMNATEKEDVNIEDDTVDFSPYDVAFILDASADITIVQSIASRYPTTQFVISSPGSHGDQKTSSNINFMWGHIYQARYLAGYLAGMFMPKGSTICLQRASNASETSSTANSVYLSQNAFIWGFQKNNQNSQFLSYTIKTKNVPYESSTIADLSIKELDCDLLVPIDVDIIQPQNIFTNAKRYVIGSDSDTRIDLGDFVLTSPSFRWEVLYSYFLQQAFNRTLGFDAFSLGYEVNATFLTPFSAHISPEIISKFQEEERRMIEKGPLNYVLCGDIFDTNNVQRINKNSCLDTNELYSIDWNILGYSDSNLILPYPEHDDNTIPDSVWVSTIAIMTLLLLIIVVLALWTWLNRNHAIIKFSQPNFLLILLFGCSIGVLSAATLIQVKHISNEQAYELGTEGLESLDDGLYVANISCNLAAWLLLTGYGLTFPVLIAKTYRLHIILENAKRPGGRKKDRVVSSWVMSKYIGAFLLIIYFFLMLNQILSPLKYQIYVEDEDDFGNPISSYGFCEINRSAEILLGFTVAVVAMTLIIGIYVCFISRNDETVNNEVAYISMAMMNFLQIVVIAGPLTTVLQAKTISRFMIQAGSIFLGFSVLIFLVFIPKIIAIIFYDEQAAQFTIRSQGNNKIVTGSLAARKRSVIASNSNQGNGMPPRTPSLNDSTDLDLYNITAGGGARENESDVSTASPMQAQASVSMSKLDIGN